MLTLSLILQWGGSLLVLISYILYRYGGFSAPLVGFVASAILVAWTVTAEAWGYCMLNVILCGVNLWTFGSWQRDRREAKRGFWKLG